MLCKVLILLLCEQILAYEKPLYDLEQAHDYFEAFLRDFNVSYADRTEYSKRFETFQNNLVQINVLNERESHAVFAINRFSDLTPEEFVARHTGYDADSAVSRTASSCSVIDDNSINTRNAPESLDWRSNNAVTQVKNQLTCGSCWTFSATGAIEGAYAIKHHQLLEFSEQQLLDCDQTGNCVGGFPMNAFEMVREIGGQMLEQDYPYQNQKQVCRFNRQAARVRVTGCVLFQLRNEELIKEALANYGPLSIAIDSSNFSLINYHGGIVRQCYLNKLNHAVLLVGYGTEDGIPYWIVKNSYGPQWGEGGYFRLMRGVNACGLASNVAAVLVE